MQIEAFARVYSRIYLVDIFTVFRKYRLDQNTKQKLMKDCRLINLTKEVGFHKICEGSNHGKTDQIVQMAVALIQTKEEYES